MADTYYSTEAAAQRDALTDASKAITKKNEYLVSRGVVTLSSASVENDVHRLELIKAGAIMDWASARIVSTNAALAGTIGLVNAATGTYTPFATLTAASNIGRASAPTGTPGSFDAITADSWVAYRLGASPATSGSAHVHVGRTVLSC
jgi:hypothetical protein